MILDSNTKVYIAGCGGMLGDAVYNYFCKRVIVKATDIDINAEWLEYADVRDYKQMEKSIMDFEPDLIINLAALTDLEYCERNIENTWITNGLGAENIALISSKLGVPCVYISTAGIFDGKQDVYNDFDNPNPLSLYAKGKYYGEDFIKKYLEKYYIFRAGWMMGGGPKKDKKFINKIYKQIKAGAQELFVVNDKLGTPTYTLSFAESIFKVVETDMYGLYNQVCGGDCSRYDVAVEFVRLLGLEEKIKVTKVKSDYFIKEYFVTRPNSEKLVNLKLNSRKVNFMPDWKDALKDYSKIYKEDLENENSNNRD